MSVLDEVINTCRDQYYQPTQARQEQARAELAVLRARLASAEQAVNEARNILESCASLDRYESASGAEDARTWFAAHPAQQSKEVKA